MSRATLGTLIGLQVVLVSSSIAMNGNSTTYFPMHVGDKWYYDSPLPQSNPWAMKAVRDSMSIGNRTYYRWTYGDGVDAFDTLTSDSVGNIWKYVGGSEYLMFDFQRDNGTSYRYELGDRWGDSVYYYTVSVWTDVSATTPAGVFQHCIRFLFDESQVKDEEVIYTFAPNVGLIIQQNNGWSIKKLTSAIAGEKRLPL